MKVIAIMPIKLKNERCPGKNTRMLGNKPLLQYELDSLKQLEWWTRLTFIVALKM